MARKQIDDSSKEKYALRRAAESLSQRIAHSKEYEVVSEKKEEQPKASAVESWIWSSEYDEALKLEKELASRYKGKDLEEAIAGSVDFKRTRRMLRHLCLLHLQLQNVNLRRKQTTPHL